MIFSGTTRVTVRLGNRQLASMRTRNPGTLGHRRLLSADGVMGLIEKTPGVCGGSARVVRTRIPVWVIEGYRQLGLAPAEVLDLFPSLRAVDVEAALEYARVHPREIATEIAENESA